MLFLLSVLFLLTGIVVVFACTRFIPSLERVSFTEKVPLQISAIQAYLLKEEKLFSPKPGTEKVIFFPKSSTGKSKLSFVYLHGFSASRQEASPIFEKVAEQLNSPIFMTRLKGHGLGAEELGSAKKSDWIKDALEAYQIGLRLGDEVVLTCMSTGCALGLYLAYFFPEKIKALIMLSPNYSPADPRSFLALGPLGPLITQTVIGKYRQFKAANSQQAYYWTTRYRTSVIPEMISLVYAAKKLDLSKIKIPILTIYTPFDKVVSAEEIELNSPRLGSNKNKLIPLIETQEHVLGGDIMNPLFNERIINESIDFIKSIL